jgi:5-methylcytosine-specific restriction protein A
MARAVRPRGERRADDRRSASQRGYTADWNRLARQHRQAHPLCADCLRQGLTTAAALVDHITPIRGPHDPGRLDPANLQSLCRRCHTIKTRAERGDKVRAAARQPGSAC